MADPTLHMNGRPCGACDGTGDIRDRWFAARRCPDCRGLGRVAIPDAEIVAAHVAEARRWYWPERVRRWAR